MQDIVPSSAWKRRKPRNNKTKPEAVQLEWKLPARLRRPIRAELKRQAGLKQAGESESIFKRRSIETKVASAKPPAYGNYRNTAEQHTGDVYMRAQPDAHIPLPPYKGHFNRPVRGLQKEAVLRQKNIKGQGKNILTTARVRKTGRQLGVPKGKVNERVRNEVDKGRDVPYQFKDEREGAGAVPAESWEGSNVEQREDQIRLPRRWLSGRTERSGWRMRYLFKVKVKACLNLLKRPQTAINAGVLLVGCAIVILVVGSLQNVGRSEIVYGSVRQKAEQAYGKVLAASDALAETDFNSSEEAFVDARTILREAQGELDQALSASKNIMQMVDVTGTLKSGRALLQVGQYLSSAGEHVAKGGAALLTSRPVASEADGYDQGQTVMGALVVANEQLSAAAVDLKKAEAMLADIKGLLLPDQVKAKVSILRESVPRIIKAVDSFVDQSSVLKAVLGADRNKQYLLLFENNHEIRPTGGFIGTIGLIDVDRGEVESVDIKTVYEADGQLGELIAPPDPLLPITDRWYLRDANWFVDYPKSARKVAEFFEKEGGPTVDGVIALTPEVIRQLLAITGPIEVPAYGVKVDADNFWLVAQDQVSYSYDKQLNKPKQFLVDLMPLLLRQLWKLPPKSTLGVFDLVAKMASEKHLLMYFRDEKLQEEMAYLGWTGGLPKGRVGLLAINNANIAGHKSDQFMEQEIDHRLALQKDGSVDVVTTIRRTHNGPNETAEYDYPEDENPATKDNIIWQRFLVDESAQLLDAQGFTSEADIPRYAAPTNSVYDIEPDLDVVEWQTGQKRHESGTIIGHESGYKFFANWIVTAPGETSVALYHYKLPNFADMPGLFDPAGKLETLLVKQPGDMRTQVRVEVQLPDKFKIVHAVPGLGLTWEGSNKIVYRGKLNRDKVVGVVFETN